MNRLIAIFVSFYFLVGMGAPVALATVNGHAGHGKHSSISAKKVEPKTTTDSVKSTSTAIGRGDSSFGSHNGHTHSAGVLAPEAVDCSNVQCLACFEGDSSHDMCSSCFVDEGLRLPGMALPVRIVIGKVQATQLGQLIGFPSRPFVAGRIRQIDSKNPSQTPLVLRL